MYRGKGDFLGFDEPVQRGNGHGLAFFDEGGDEDGGDEDGAGEKKETVHFGVGLGSEKFFDVPARRAADAAPAPRAQGADSRTNRV
jgi:hypothetical protein